MTILGFGENYFVLPLLKQLLKQGTDEVKKKATPEQSRRVAFSATRCLEGVH